jgi:broad specificity phosphatase PhoE
MAVRTIFHLIRHAAHDRVGTVLVGRLNGVHLSLAGRAQAKELAHHFAREDISGVISSPRERAQETAEPIAQQLGLEMRVSNALDEINMGGWQGHSFSALALDEGWQRWNACRSMTRPPRGETVAEVQSRMLGELLHIHATETGGQFILVSHAEPIRSLLLHILGMSADGWSRIEIEPASISTIALDTTGGRILTMNMPASVRVPA